MREGRSIASGASVSVESRYTLVSCENSFPRRLSVLRFVLVGTNIRKVSVALSKTNVIKLEDDVNISVAPVNGVSTHKDNGEEHYVCRWYNPTFITSPVKESIIFPLFMIMDV